jgi:TolA-binding protein
MDDLDVATEQTGRRDYRAEKKKGIGVYDVPVGKSARKESEQEEAPARPSATQGYPQTAMAQAAPSPTRVDELVAKARSLEPQDPAAAALEYEHLVAVFPDDWRTGEWLLKAEQLFSRAGRFQQALAACQRIEREHPRQAPKAMLLRANIEGRLRGADFEDGIYRELIDRYSTAPEAQEARQKIELKRAAKARAHERTAPAEPAAAH